MPRHTLRASFLAMALYSGAALAQPRSGEGTDEAVIRGRRAEQDLAPHGVTQEEMQRAPGTFGDALRAIQNLPGVARAPSLSGSLYVRGASPTDTLVLVEGIPLPALYHFGALGSTVATETIERIEFFPGNFSVRAGRATGALVDVDLRAPPRTGARTIVHLDVINAGVFSEAALSPRLAVSVSARFGWLGYVLSPVLSALAGVQNTVTFRDYQAQVSWRPNGRDTLRAVLIGSGDGLDFASPADQVAIAGGLQYHTLLLSWSRRFSLATKLTVSFSGGWNDMGADVQLGPDGSDLDGAATLRSAPIHARAEVLHTFGPRHELRVGFDGLFGWRDYAFRRPPTMAYPAGVGIGFEDFLVQPALYAELLLVPVAALRIRAGVRLEASLETETAILSPRLNVEWSAWRGGTLRAGIGHFVQPPLNHRTSVGFELLLPTTYPTRTDGRSRPEQAIHLNVGVEQRIRAWLTASVLGFARQARDVLVGYNTLDARLADGAPIGAFFNQDGRGRALGLEVLVRIHPGALVQGSIAYTLSRSERSYDAGSPLAPYDFDQTHVFTALGRARLGRGWEVGLRFRYVTGRPTETPRTVQLGLSGAEPYLSVAREGERVPDFHQLDLRVEKAWALPWGRLALSLEVINVYNRLNAERFTWDHDHAVSRPASFFLPIVPNLGVRGEL